MSHVQAGTNNAGTAPPVPPHPPPSHPNGRRTENRPENSSPVMTPVTPHTALPSSVSENGREYPFVKTWNGKKAAEPFCRLSGGIVKHGETRPAPPVGTREFPVVQRTVSGPVESRSVEKDIHPRRVSAPTQSTGSVHSNSPIMDPLRIGKRVAPEPLTDAHGQVVSTYAGVEAGWRPAPPPSRRSSHSQRSPSHSRPATPDRPLKRARTAETAETEDAKNPEESSKTHTDVDITSNTARKPSVPSGLVPSETMQPPANLEKSGREMTSDERLMFTSLTRVITKKRDNDGWKCMLCRYVDRLHLHVELILIH